MAGFETPGDSVGFLAGSNDGRNADIGYLCRLRAMHPLCSPRPVAG